jgi:hypothetical protein
MPVTPAPRPRLAADRAGASMEHALDLAAVHALFCDEEEVRAVGVGLRADEYKRCVSP